MQCEKRVVNFVKILVFFKSFRISDMQFPKIHTSFAYQQNTMTVKLTLQDAKITGAVDWWFRYIDWITWYVYFYSVHS